MNCKFFKLFLFSFLTCSSLFLGAQRNDPEACINLNLKSKIVFFEVDFYQNIYVVDQNSILSKLNSKGDFISSYGNGKFGSLSSINVLNPMKIMLFYKETGVILFLDEKLTPISEPFYLFEKNYQHISLASFSYSNQIILFDPIDSKLILLDFFMNEISQNQITLKDFNPIKLIPIYEKGIVFHDPLNGLIFFDSFGTFEKSIPILTNAEIQINGNIVGYFENSIWHEYDFRNLDFRELKVEKMIQTTNSIAQLKNQELFFIGIDQTGKLFICNKIF